MLCNGVAFKFNILNKTFIAQQMFLSWWSLTDRRVQSERILMSFIRKTQNLDKIKKLPRAPIKLKHFKIRKLILRMSIIKMYKLKKKKKDD